MKKIVWRIFKILIVFFVLLTFFFAYLSFFHKELLLDYLDKIKLIVENLGYWNYVIILFFWFIESFPLVWVSVPWQTVLIIIAWFLGYKYIFISIFLAFIWAVLWNYVWYLLGIKYWEKFFKKYGKFMWIWTTDIKYIKKWIDKNWWLFVVFWKFHNLFRAFVPFIAWSSWMKNFHFVMANIVGSFLRAVVMVILWVFFVENAEIILKNIWKIILFVVALFVLYVFFFKKEELKKYIKEKSKEMDDMIKD